MSFHANPKYKFSSNSKGHVVRIWIFFVKNDTKNYNIII